MLKRIVLLFKIALRDSRHDRSKLALFMSSIILGVAALVAINSFNNNLTNDIQVQSKSLLGADLVVKGNKPVTDSMKQSFVELEGEMASDIELFSMAFIPKAEESQFVKIKAIEGNFPFYGILKTIPKAAAHNYKNSLNALVDEGMMLQFDLKVGDSIKLGNVKFSIAGKLLNTLGGMGLGSSFAPSVYIGLDNLAATELVQPGSLLAYSYSFKTNPEFDLMAWSEKYDDLYRYASMRVTTIKDQQMNLKEAFSSLNSFLNLVALISLLLASIGVASSVFIYVRMKISSIAIMRCIGMKGDEAFRVYFFQIASLGLIAVIFGAIIGSLFQVYLPVILKNILPYEVVMSISWPAIIEGIIVGFLLTILFALIPLVKVRNVSPLNTLRVTNDHNGKPNLIQMVIYALIGLGLFLFLWLRSGAAKDAIIFTLGLAVVFLILFLVSRGVMWMVKRILSTEWPYVLRQGLSNLYRPNNQTLTLIMSIGIGTAILTTLFILQGLILDNVSGMGAGKQPNMILFGIEAKQKQYLESLTKEFDMPILQHVPVVTMALKGWKGRTKSDWLADTTRTAKRWAINREARVSYRKEMDPSEQLLEGKYIGYAEKGDSIFISLAQRFAKGLDVEIGDELVWNVQGTMLTTYVGSIRKINFRKLDSRFFILFPNNVLEKAPQFYILVTKSPSKNITATYRNAVVKQMPNVSVIDLSSILVTLNEIIQKVSYIVKFMAGFSILIGIVVLISSLYLSKFQRIQETVLLRTIGAGRKKILQINIVEYASLGLLASSTGIIIALVSSFILAKYVFDMEFSIQWWSILFILMFICLLTIIIGMYNTREVIKKSPLEVLRRE